MIEAIVSQCPMYSGSTPQFVSRFPVILDWFDRARSVWIARYFEYA